VTRGGPGVTDTSVVVDRWPLVSEPDVVAARQRARLIAELTGFDRQDQARVATAVSEIARNAVRYAQGGRVEFVLEGGVSCRGLSMVVTDEGPGIRDLQAILDGTARSASATGLGLVGARRLMDRCEIGSGEGGTRVAMTKLVDPGRALPLCACVERVQRALAEARIKSPVEELRQQQRELLVALGEARERQERLADLNRELEDTNRGVVALYAELDEKAMRLRQADEMKSRFLSNMSHEFRTPLNSIRALTGLLLGRVDGPLSVEQARQVELIGKAANDLSELVEDLLDIARIEAGKLEIREAEFTAENLFSALRGMLRPLIGDDVTLRFVPPEGAPPIVSDEAKVAQILRNFISNALKFTEHGHVRVAARVAEEEIEFSVADTGIGIAPEDQERIFEEFVQVQGPLQRRAKGTGLGLPLCRRLAHALGGSVRVESTIGEGSTFFLTLPSRPRPADDETEHRPSGVHASIRVLVAASAEAGWRYEQILRDSVYRAVVVPTYSHAAQCASRERFAAVVLDATARSDGVELAAFDGMTLLHVHAAGAHVPADSREHATMMTSPVDRVALIEWLNRSTRTHALVVEDDRAARYAMRRLLEKGGFAVVEASTGEEGLRAAAAARPGVIVLDLGLPDIDGFAMLDRLGTSPDTCDVPIVICTSRELSGADRARLDRGAYDVVAKRDMTAQIAAAATAAATRTRRKEVV
jgi:signal transduction histidine kinase/ActR/RegA family two-component response regulator